MEIVGGFMVMFSILAFFLVVVWLVFPFVVFAMKAKLDRTFVKIEEIECRLATIEKLLGPANTAGNQGAAPADISPDDDRSSPTD